MSEPAFVGDADDAARWSSRFSFLYSAAAASIGLGSLWRFPYVAGSNGGGAFVLLYLFFIAILCVPIIVAEMVIGKRGSGSPVESIGALVRSENTAGWWRVIGWISLIVPFFGLSYYSVVAAWTLDYARLAITPGFAGLQPTESLTLFQTETGSAPLQLVLHALFLAAAVAVVARGLHAGVERISIIKMTALAVVLAGIVLYNAIVFGLGPSLHFLFYPDFSALKPSSVLAAFGQALFSTGIGVGVLMTYSAFVPRGISLPQSGVLLAVAVAVIATCAGLAIFPTVLHYGLAPGEGPSLIFVTLPIAFGQMTGGRLVGIVFFCLVALSAFSSMVGMLVPTVTWLQERTGLRRGAATACAGAAIWLVGLPSLLSFNMLKDVRPLSFLPYFANASVFGILDGTIANVLLPFNALLIALFAGWAMRRESVADEFREHPRMLWLWRVSLRYLAPLAIAWLLLSLR